MQVLIDADGCPVVAQAIQCCKPYPDIEITVVCDTSHLLSLDGVNIVTVSKGADSADFYLVNCIKKGDLVITQDYGLAAMCLAKKARVFRQDGFEYTNERIDSMLFVRHANKKARLAGKRIKGPAKRTEKDNQAFITAFSRALKD